MELQFKSSNLRKIGAKKNWSQEKDSRSPKPVGGRRANENFKSEFLRVRSFFTHLAKRLSVCCKAINVRLRLTGSALVSPSVSPWTSNLDAILLARGKRALEQIKQRCNLLGLRWTWTGTWSELKIRVSRINRLGNSPGS